jgi:site-specific recombinase XerC
VGLLYGFGLGRSELVRLDAADIHAGDGVLTIQGKANELRNEDQLCAADSVSTLAIPHGHTRFAPEDVI